MTYQHFALGKPGQDIGVPPGEQGSTKQLTTVTPGKQFVGHLNSRTINKDYKMQIFYIEK